jgi:hypothetical protein
MVPHGTPRRIAAWAEALGKQACLAGLYLQWEVFGVDPALGETAGDEPEARLRRAREHVAQLLFRAEAPLAAEGSS